MRPEALRLTPEGALPATVQGSEYLGADLVLRCAVGQRQSLLVRLDGRGNTPAPGSAVRLGWAAEDLHQFDAQGRRIPSFL